MQNIVATQRKHFAYILTMVIREPL